MLSLRDHPVLVFVVSLAAMWLSARIGILWRQRIQAEDEEQHDFDTVLTATLTLLGLIIGFSFSMAISRYDQRKNYEAEEANAIGTELARTDLLPDAIGKQARDLLRKYVQQRLRFYRTRDFHQLRQIEAATAELHTQMWSSVRAAAAQDRSPVIALSVSGMNDVLNTEAYTQAAWWNRLPDAVWGLMGTIAIFCNLLIGYGARRKGVLLFLVLPLALSVSFFLIADIDSPRGGLILVHPLNLERLAQSFPGVGAAGP
jgi:hypothetical protein